MNREDIQTAIEKAKKGIEQYSELMDIFGRVDVSTDFDFQRRYNAFYRVQRRSKDWYVKYYSLMQSLKGKKADFGEVLEWIRKATERYEPSFASKLVATIDPAKAVWDVHVLENTGLTAPSYAIDIDSKVTKAKAVYRSMERWYDDFLKSPTGALCISEFDRKVDDPKRFTPLKKVDFILWQHRKP